MVIPIVSATNLLSVFILAFLVFHTWQKTRTGKLPSLQAFAVFFTAAFVLLVIAALPGFLVKDLLAVQRVIQVFDLAFYVTLAALVQFFAILLFPANRLLLAGTPLLLLVLGLGVFVRHMLYGNEPATTIQFPFGENLSFLVYEWSTPLLIDVFSGLVGLAVFGTTAALFFRQGTLASHSRMRERSYLIGAGLAVSAIGIAFSFIVGALPGLKIFAFVSSVSVLLSLLLIYRGAMMRTEERV